MWVLLLLGAEEGVLSIRRRERRAGRRRHLLSTSSTPTVRKLDEAVKARLRIRAAADPCG